MEKFTQKNSNRKILKDILPLDRPLGICIEPVNICNMKCVHCPVSLKEFKDIVGGVGYLNMTDYSKILNDIKQLGGTIQINLYGDGEPFLNKDLLKMVKLAKEDNIAEKVTITTNGTLIDTTKYQELIESGLDYLRVSIYSMYEDKHKEITNTKISPSTIYNNIKEFKKYRDNLGVEKPFIYAKLIDTYSKENELFLEKFSSIVDQVNIETPMNWNGYMNKDFIHKIDKEDKTDQSKIQGFYEEKGKSGMKKICTTAFHSLNIKQNGDVCICIVDWNHGTVVGNIKQESLESIWFGDRLRRFRKMHIDGKRNENESCKNCNYMFGNPDNIDNLSEEQYNLILNYKGK